MSEFRVDDRSCKRVLSNTEKSPLVLRTSNVSCQILIYHVVPWFFTDEQ